MPTARKPDEQWIAEFMAAHGREYGYRTPSYKLDTNRYFTAVCRHHGDFPVPAGNHAKGFSKCPKCSGTAGSARQLQRKSHKDAQNRRKNAENTTKMPPKS